MADTRVLRAPAVAMCGRGVVVAEESAERPVHACTSSGAWRDPPRAPSTQIAMGIGNCSVIRRR